MIKLMLTTPLNTVNSHSTLKHIMNKKLTLISVGIHGKTESRFVMADADKNGKVSIPSAYLENMAESAKGTAVHRGETYTIG